MRMSDRQVKFVGLGFFLAASLISSLAFADPRLDHCNKVLEGDLFNKVISSKSDVQTKRNTVWQMFLSMSEDEALDLYKKQSQSSVGQGVGVNVVIPYINVPVGVDQNYNRALTDEEFRQQYQKMKSMNKGSSSADSSSRTARVSNLSVLTRDAGSIQAWEKCVSQDEQPGLYAYGTRKGSGKPFIKVVWAPGKFSVPMPFVDISFALPDGVEIKGLKENDRVKISAGGGRAFSLRSEEEEKAIEIYVNASFKDMFNDTYEAIVPPKEVPAVKLPDPTVASNPTVEAPIGGPLTDKLLVPPSKLSKLKSQFSFRPSQENSTRSRSLNNIVR